MDGYDEISIDDIELLMPTPNSDDGLTRRLISHLSGSTGCRECSDRFLVCDGGQPACALCISAGIPCSGSDFNGSSPISLMIPRSMGNPYRDPFGVFGRINSPDLDGLDSLVNWMSVKTEDHPEGWLGGLTPAWVKLLSEHGHEDPAFLSLTSQFVLKIQGALTRTDTKKQIMRAQSSTMKELQNHKTVNGLTLMVICGLGITAGEDGDFETAEAHFRALRTLYLENQDTIQIGPIEWMFTWGTDLRAATSLGRMPMLPYYIPPVLRNMDSLPYEEVSMAHRLASKNALALSSLAQSDYLDLLGLFQDLHVGLIRNQNGIPPQNALATHGQSYSLAYRALMFMGKCQSEIESSRAPATKCRQLLAVALQLCARRSIDVRIRLHASIYDTEAPGYFPRIQTALLNKAATTVSHDLESSEILDNWRSFTTLEGLIWVFSILVLGSLGYQRETSAYWTNTLQEAVQRHGINNEDELRWLLKHWPCETRHIDIVVEKVFEVL